MAFTISQTARAVLTSAAARSDHIAMSPDHLPIAAQRSVIKSLLKAGLLEEMAADGDEPAWRTGDAGERHALRLTLDGMAAVAPTAGIKAASSEAAETGPCGAEPGAEAPRLAEPPQAAQEGPSAPTTGNTRPTLRSAAQAVVAAWDEADGGHPALSGAIEALRSALPGGRPDRVPSGASRVPRTDTKQAAVLALLRRPEGASGPVIAEATGWAAHTVRGFLAGLAKKGITVSVLERVRQVGPGKEGAKGSYTVYRIEEVG